MPENMDQLINPQVRTIKVGTRTLREVKIYPLSMADELRFVKTVGESIQSFRSPEVMDSETLAIGFISQLVEENLPELVKMVADDVETSELTNTQALEIAEIIIDENFGKLSKNVKSLSEKIKKVFHLERLQQSSVSSTQDTDLTTSSEKVSKKGGRQKGS